MSFRQPDSLSDPGQDGFAVTPADSDFAIFARCLYVGTGGTVVVVTVTGTTLTFSNVQNGSILPVSVRQVKAATTASNIVGLY